MFLQPMHDFRTNILPAETSDRTLEDIDRLFREDKSVFIFRNKAAIAVKQSRKYIPVEEDIDGRRLMAGEVNVGEDDEDAKSPTV